MTLTCREVKKVLKIFSIRYMFENISNVSQDTFITRSLLRSLPLANVVLK